MKNIKQSVKKFMTDVDTSEMNSNEFIYEYYFYDILEENEISPFEFYRFFLNWPSVETILRDRRWLVKNDVFTRSNKSKDKEIDYIKENAIQNKF